MLHMSMWVVGMTSEIMVYTYIVAFHQVEVASPIGLKAPVLRHVDLVLDWIVDAALHQTTRSAALVVGWGRVTAP